jgi:nickel-dependent lactate racemase
MTALNIPFGKNLKSGLPELEQIASIRAPQQGIKNIPVAVAEALTTPLDFPSLDQTLVPDDRLALVVDPQLPALIEVVAATLEWFCARGTPATHIRVVLAGDGQWEAASVAQAIQQQSRIAVEVERHDCDDSEQLAYVAANDASDPIYLNRTVVDADVVIPISCARSPSALDYFGPFGLFPLLSNRTTRGEFYSLPRLEDVMWRGKLQAWADQAAWWVGVMVGVEVIPASHDGVAKILAGQLQPLEEAAQSSMSEVWHASTAADSDLVIALLDGCASTQSWLSVARAIFAAQRWVSPQGSIVIGSQLQAAIGKGLGRLRNPHQSPEAIAKKLASDPSDDAIAAAVILQAISSHHVYLISELRSDALESLGLGAINDPEQLTRLVMQHASCTLVEAAQHRTLEHSHA